MRDFIHIDDCVSGVLTTMDKIDDGDAINLSSGIYTSFIELAGMATRRPPATRSPLKETPTCRPAFSLERATHPSRKLWDLPTASASRQVSSVQ